MGRLHLYAIGGSGARVVRSLLFLMGGGALKDQDVLINMLDLDNKIKANSDVENLQGLYNNIKEGLGIIPENAPINLFGAECTYNNGNQYFTEVVRDDFKTFLTGSVESDFGENHSFGNNNFGNLKLLMESLYSPEKAESDFRELRLPLEKGFYGNPNIGSVVMNHITNDVGFRNSINSIADDDKVFIIGSIFGGTGAAGYPSFVRILNDNKKMCKIGSLLLLPYFKLSSEVDRIIFDEEWKAKTKSALNYYVEDELIKTKVSSKYFIGDDYGRTFKYCHGGINQVNPAGVVELIGAFSILHFINEIQTDVNEYGFFLKNKTPEQTNLEGVFEGDKALNLKNFFDSTANDNIGSNNFNLYIKPLLRLGILYKVFEELDSSRQDNYKNVGFVFPSNYYKSSIVNNQNIRDLWKNIKNFTYNFKKFLDELKRIDVVQNTKGRTGLFFNFEHDFDRFFNEIIGININGGLSGVLIAKLHNSTIDANDLNNNQKLLAAINHLIDTVIIPQISIETYN